MGTVPSPSPSLVIVSRSRACHAEATRRCSYEVEIAIWQWRMLRVKHLCSLCRGLRSVKRCNKWWTDSVDPHRNWSTDLNFCCCLVCLLQWRTLLQHMYLVKCAKILLIFVANLKKKFGGTAPRPPATPSIAPILIHRNHRWTFLLPPVLGV